MTLRLYDLCGDADLRFSPYCARVKMALALKGLAYETVPVPFKGIAGIADGAFKTVPVLEEGDGLRTVDSFAIAERLDVLKPEPPLFAPGEAGKAAARFVEATMFSVVHAQAMPFVALSIHDRLQPEDQGYFRESREARLGRSMETAFEAALPRLDEYRKVFQPIRQVLSRYPWLGGERPLFVDAIAYGSLHWLHAVSDLDWLAEDATVSDWLARCRAVAAG